VQAVKAKAEMPASAIALRKALVLLVICELSVRKIRARRPQWVYCPSGQRAVLISRFNQTVIT
jgi:hypothetical protein